MQVFVALVVAVAFVPVAWTAPSTCETGPLNVHDGAYFLAPFTTHVVCLGPDGPGTYRCVFRFAPDVPFTGGVQCQVDGVVIFTCQVVASTPAPCPSPTFAAPHQVEFVTYPSIFVVAEGGAGAWHGEVILST